tara:strand:- start:1979 stop:2866 length:888 start_codon:yes stop_codon:yes gene_type:complete
MWSAFNNGFPVLPVRPGEKRPALANWQQFNQRTPTADEMRDWSVKFQGHSVGIAAASELGFVALDCDVLDVDQSKACWRALVGILDGHAPPLRIGLAPKWLALVGTNKKRIATRKNHPFEVFGHTGQFVAYGVHPKTGKPYRWFNGCPMTVSIDELPVITETQVNHWLMECNKIINPNPTGSASPVEPYYNDNLTPGEYRTRLSKEREGLRGPEYGFVIMKQLAMLGPNNKSDILISVVSSLIYRGFSDENIIEICREPYLDEWEGIEEHGLEFLQRMLARVRRNKTKLWGSSND